MKLTSLDPGIVGSAWLSLWMFTALTGQPPQVDRPGPITRVHAGVGCTGRIGDRVWRDLNGNGIQELGEPGLGGVRVLLLDSVGNLLQSTLSAQNGRYAFNFVCQDNYLIDVDLSSVPAGLVPSPCDQGTNDRIDSDCTPFDYRAPDDAHRVLRIDFGFTDEPPPPEGEGCTPGYWRQEQHFDSWPAPYTPDMLFSDVFEDAFPGRTLAEVVDDPGGPLKTLGFHTVAALLNAQSSGVDFGIPAAEVISRFNATFPGTDAEYVELKDFFAELNDRDCPLN
jgi:hypothetical protein